MRTSKTCIRSTLLPPASRAGYRTPAAAMSSNPPHQRCRRERAAAAGFAILSLTNTGRLCASPLAGDCWAIDPLLDPGKPVGPLSGHVDGGAPVRAAPEDAQHGGQPGIRWPILLDSDSGDLSGKSAPSKITTGPGGTTSRKSLLTIEGQSAGLPRDSNAPLSLARNPAHPVPAAGGIFPHQPCADCSPSAAASSRAAG